MRNIFLVSLLAGILCGCATTTDHGPVVKEEVVETKTWEDVWRNEHSVDIIRVTYRDGTTRKYIK